MARSKNYSNQGIHYTTAKKRADCKTEKRNCMCCDRVFDSEGIHNRICPKCKTTSEWCEGNVDVASLPTLVTPKGKS